VTFPYVGRYESRIAAAYWRAKFCLQPFGDSISRKGIIDAVLLGCIPVLFHRGQAVQWPWHWGDWAANASVLVDEAGVRAGTLDVLALLAAVPAERVAEMQATLGRHAHRLSYAPLHSAAAPAESSGAGTGGGGGGGGGGGEGGSRGRPDALEVALAHAHRASREADVVAEGRRVQAEEGGEASEWLRGIEARRRPLGRRPLGRRPLGRRPLGRRPLATCDGGAFDRVARRGTHR
jgi:hypothetical protein